MRLIRINSNRQSYEIEICNLASLCKYKIQIKEFKKILKLR